MYFIVNDSSMHFYLFILFFKFDLIICNQNGITWSSSETAVFIESAMVKNPIINQWIEATVSTMLCSCHVEITLISCFVNSHSCQTHYYKWETLNFMKALNFLTWSLWCCIKTTKMAYSVQCITFFRHIQNVLFHKMLCYLIICISHVVSQIWLILFLSVLIENDEG